LKDMKKMEEDDGGDGRGEGWRMEKIIETMRR
jgi:hypothetical protein